MTRGGPIAFFLPTLSGGGAERVVVNLAQAIAERGREVHLVVAAATGELAGQVLPPVRLIDLRAGRVLQSLVPLARYLKRERPRAVVASMSHANLVAIWAGQLAGQGTPVVVTVHNTMSRSTLDQGALGARLWPWLLRVFYPRASAIVVVSRDAAEDLVRTTGLPRARVRAIYNPVITPDMLDRARITPDDAWFGPGEPPVVLGAGRLTPQKDFATLLRAFAEVHRARPCRLLILGEGEERPRLEALVAELGLGADVRLPGFRPDALGCMGAARLFVLSSAWEGLPTVLIEALAAGTAVVSTDCPSGPREILQDGRLGALVPVGDAHALAAAMRHALDCPPPAVPPDVLAPFTRDVAVDEYLRLIESV